MIKTNTFIENSLSRRKPGDLLFLSDFKGRGTEAAIRQSFSRLVKKGKLRRLAQGIYYLPKVDPLLGEIYPSADEVARKIAIKDRIKIQPSGAYALNKLGLSTQVPTRLVYLTNGQHRIITLGSTKIRFKPTTNKKLTMKGELSKLLILALEELDIKEIDQDREVKIKALLLKENPRNLQHDLQLAPGRVHDYIIRLINSK